MSQSATKRSLLLVLVALLLAGLACNLPASGGSATPTPFDSAILLTQVAQTLAAGGQNPEPTRTQAANNTPTATATRRATNIPGQPTSTPTESCDDASFIQDVTIPDGSKIPAGQAFTKTWRLQNVGSCTWNKNYALVFASGDAMGAPAVINLLADVPPNATVDLSIDFKAPATAGKYISNWKLRNSTGQVFGVSGGMPFFAMIEVVVQTLTPTITVTPTITRTPTFGASPTPTITRQPTLTSPASGVVLDMVASMCKAEWRSQAGELICPGTSGDPNGYVMRLENPRLETGANESSPVLLMVPQDTAQGALTGRFPPLPVGAGYHFQATLGCLADLPQCSVIYQLNYSVDGGDPVNLQQWQQTYDGSIQGVDVDLSALKGKSVELILVVLADGPIDQARAVWVFPRIVKR